MERKEININSIGKIVILKSNRAKHFSIRISSDAEITVTIPFRVSFKEGIRFANSKKDWISKHLSKVEVAKKEKLIFDENVNFKTRNHKLVIKKMDVDDVYLTINEKFVILKIPKERDVKEAFIQEAVKYGITETIRIEAKEFLPTRVKYLADRFGFKYNKVFLKNLKSRWGSCSGTNNINLNIHLIRLPDKVIDYVILHELSHTIQKNHSKKFWLLLESTYPNCKKYDKELKKYSPLYF